MVLEEQTLEFAQVREVKLKYIMYNYRIKQSATVLAIVWRRDNTKESVLKT